MCYIMSTEPKSQERRRDSMFLALFVLNRRYYMEKERRINKEIMKLEFLRDER